MEPQIKDYYNEMPYGINVIDKLNEEYEVLRKKYESLKEKYEPEKSFEQLLGTSIRFKGTHYDIANLFYHQYKDTYKFTNYKHKQWHYYNHSTCEWELLNDEIEIRKNITSHLTHLYEKKLKEYEIIIESEKLENTDEYEIAFYYWENTMGIIEKLKSSKFKNGVIKECRELFYIPK
jgi:hypothetical protein